MKKPEKDSSTGTVIVMLIVLILFGEIIGKILTFLLWAALICIIGAIGYAICLIISKIILMIKARQRHSSSLQQIPKEPETITDAENNNDAAIASIYTPETDNITNDHNSTDTIDLTYPLTIFPEIEDLIWIADGKDKNYTLPTGKRSRSGNVVVIVSDPEEPSALYLSLPVSKPPAGKLIESPPYSPEYKELSPEQRWMYWEFLADPFSSRHNIGYVFLFYYGLERHMISGNLDKAFELILKLREVYSNGSFQSYTADTLIRLCLEKQRTDLVSELLESYNANNTTHIPINYLLILKYEFHDPLTVSEIIKNYQYFGFSNNRYIKNEPELFKESLLGLIQQSFQADSIDLNRHFPIDISELPIKQERIFANYSLRDYETAMPSFHNPRLINKILTLLKKSHEAVKSRLRYGNNANLQSIDRTLKIGGRRFEKGPFTSADGHAFEAYCANLLSSDGFTSIEVTPDSQDQGVDVIAQKDGVKYGIQCKLYSKSVGNSAIQQIYSGITFYGCQKGIVLTNSYFTEAARELADVLGVTLWDKQQLLELQKQHLEN